ncbi:MAG: type I restriction enzyme HsdR N-terminal domain-containing protein [Saprospiraceae bacterium]|nr:type I restriction enzyme HsdR N-terminal domain-containing protein [Saprospiraceae bacterium]
MDIDWFQYQHKLRIKTNAERRSVYDVIRKKYVALTKEELVRQLVIHYFIETLQYPRNSIAVEKHIEVNGLKKRFDVVVFTHTLQAWLLVECKSPEVAVSQDTFRQVSMYNMHFQAAYLMVTNGIENYCAAIDYSQSNYQFLLEMPSYPALL